MQENQQTEKTLVIVNRKLKLTSLKLNITNTALAAMTAAVVTQYYHVQESLFWFVLITLVSAFFWMGIIAVIAYCSDFFFSKLGKKNSDEEAV